ncbi:MAG: HAMP domain-containing sensor histidine kinase [Clostridiales bacterium]|nr:HAMP domain-containing histidine kinase [Roseburia sp.]MDD7635344.1 HAMP domain-containing sensor histidine kinase [Clostridiales bacterium]MDY4112718.1 HAMP domain-containing sensor histidine kinase [Roseburia sp.]
MKHTLYPKLLFSYVLYGVIGFLIITTFTYHLTFEFVERRDAASLYRESALISSNYAENYFSKSMTLEEIQTQLSMLGEYLSSDIWIVDTQGNIILDTAKPNLVESAEKITDFDITDFGSRYYQIGNFYGKFSNETLSVFSPITVNYKVRGYVLIHKPTYSLINYANGLIMISYETLALLFVAAFIVLILFTYIVYIPIRKITKAADHYAQGDFETKIDIHSSDEIGYLAASLNYMANELNTLEDDQKKFISNVSHDFRSPLTSIKGYVEAMLDGTIPVEMQDKYLNIILFETERLNKLTKSLLELNKFGSHGTMLDITNFDINYTIRMTAQTFEGICKEKRISFDLILTGEKLYVSADMSKIQQVLYNLIDNALKFSHPDSTITIETTEKNEKIFVSVKDTGIGIPKDSIKKIWERFYKTDLSRGKDKKGTGLGLAIVKEIIQAHGENINCISTEGVGTEFIFTLPLAKEK